VPTAAFSVPRPSLTALTASPFHTFLSRHPLPCPWLSALHCQLMSFQGTSSLLQEGLSASSTFFSLLAAGLLSDEYERQQYSPLRRHTPFCVRHSEVGALRLLLLGQGAGNLTRILPADNEGIVHLESWEACPAEGESRS